MIGGLGQRLKEEVRWLRTELALARHRGSQGLEHCFALSCPSALYPMRSGERGRRRRDRGPPHLSWLLEALPEPRRAIRDPSSKLLCSSQRQLSPSSPCRNGNYGLWSSWPSSLHRPFHNPDISIHSGEHRDQGQVGEDIPTDLRAH